MSAAIDTLRAAAAAGVRVTVNAGRLVLKASVEPPAALIDALRRHKADIIALLDPVPASEGAPSRADVWAAALAKLSRQRCPPPDVSYRRWDLLRDDFARFRDHWAGPASAMGWRPRDLLGWDPRLGHYSPIAKHRGLAWRFEGAAVVEVWREAIVIERLGIRTPLPRPWQM